MSYTEKNNSKKEAQRNFYFNNVYPQDPEKAKQMGLNIHRDLYPFYGYLKTSIDCVEKKSSTGAEVKIVDDENKVILLVLGGSLGAKQINNLIYENDSDLVHSRNLQHCRSSLSITISTLENIKLKIRKN